MVVLPYIRRKYMVSRIPKGATVPMSECVVTLAGDSVPYSGSPRTVGVTVTWYGATLTVNTDYTLSYSNNTNLGPATVTVTGMGQFSGSVTRTFYIVAPSAAWGGFDLADMSATPDYETTLDYGNSSISAQQMNMVPELPGHMFIAYGGRLMDWKFDDENYSLATIGSEAYNSKTGLADSVLSCTVGDGGARTWFTIGTNNNIYYATMSSYDVSGATWQGMASGISPTARPAFMAFSTDGKKFFYKSANGAIVHCANLATAYRFSSLQSEDTYNLNTTFGYSNVYGMCLAPDGKDAVIGVVTDSRPKLVRLSLASPFDFSGATVASVSPELDTFANAPMGVLVDKDGRRAIVWFSASNKLCEYSLV